MTTPQRLFALRLYRAILTTHRRVLPNDLRALGDTYVKDEFRLHKSAKAEFLPPFFEQWMKYLESMVKLPAQRAKSGEIPVGTDMSPELLNAMSEEQKLQLSKLKEEAKKWYSSDDFHDLRKT